MANMHFEWNRFWCPRSGHTVLDEHGFLLDPETEYGLRLNPDVVNFGTLAAQPCVVLLGEPGIGKSTALEDHRSQIEAEAQRAGEHILWRNLNPYTSDAHLVQSVFEDAQITAWRAGSGILHLFLDSVDECLIRIDSLAALLAEQLRRLPAERLRLRIACRTAVWPGLLEDQLQRLWGDDAVAVYELAPLRRLDVAQAATASGIDSTAFLAEVEHREAGALASKPVTVRFLLSAYQRSGGFPSTQVELYRQGCERLCEETSASRRAAQRTGTLSPAQRLQVAARIAALSVLCRRPAIWTGATVDAPEGDLLLTEVVGGREQAGGHVIDITESVVREALDTGLFTARGPERLGFAHQTYAEFLAAWYLHVRGTDTEQMLSLVTHPGDQVGRVVPQLQETAAWGGSLTPAVYDRIVECDPQVLLSSDVATMSAEARERLVRWLLQLFDAQALTDTQWGVRTKYRKLAHPCLAAQLEPYIRDRTKNTIVRRVAIDIAEACGLQSLQTLLGDIALDPTENEHARDQAAAGLIRIGDATTIARLRPCVTGQAGDDPRDELKGFALLGLWPEQLSTADVFAALTPPKQPSLIGAYRGFLLGPLRESLAMSELPVALRWAATQPARDDPGYAFGHLIEDVLRAAWARVEDPDVLEPFSRTVAQRLAEHVRVPGLERHGGDATVSPAQRRRVCDAKLPHCLERGVDAGLLVFGETPLLRAEDLSWAVERLQVAPTAAEQALWVVVVRDLFHPNHPGHVDVLLEAIPTSTVLAQEFGPLFAPVEVASSRADALRAEYRRWQEWQQEDDTYDTPLEPPPQQRVTTMLSCIEGGDLRAWWQLNLDLTLEPTSTHYGDELESDLTALPGWQAADAGTRQRIIEAAQRYLHLAESTAHEWLGTDTFNRADAAAYRALRLLDKERPDVLTILSADRWRGWAGVIVGYPTILGGPGEEPHQELVRRAYEHAPEEVIGALMRLIDAENRRHGWLMIPRKVALCWDDRLIAALAAKARDASLAPNSMGNLLHLLLEHGSRDARAFAEELLTRPIPSDELPRRRAAVAAATLLLHAEDGGWDAAWPEFVEDAGFGQDVVAIVANNSNATYAERVSQHLTEDQIGDLYLWLMEQYPPADDPHHEGAHFVGVRESIAQFRDAILRHLQYRATPAACRTMACLVAARPDLPWLQWVAVETRGNMLRRTWVPPRPDALLRMASDRDLRLVERGEQLLDVVVASLRRLELELQGDNPGAPELWNDLGGGEFRPKDENALSDYIVRHLRRDIQRRGIVANREVQIRRGEGKGKEKTKGERTDVRIDALAPGRRPDEYDRITVTVEVKGCWNRGLNTDMRGQLCDRYLAENQCRHGLYLVGWFSCRQWDADDDRNGRTPTMTRADAQRAFDDQAATLSNGGRCIRAIVLNTALR
jgi:predicted NACHT family NTPase